MKGVRFDATAQHLDGIDKLIDIFEPPMHRGIAQIRHFIDLAQFFEHLRADHGRRNFPPAGFELVHNLVNGLLKRDQTDGTFLASLCKTVHQFAAIERLVVSSYQSVSGAGQAGMDELAGQWTKWAGEEEMLQRAAVTPGALEPGEFWDRPIAGNVIPLAGSIGEQGYTSEEWKLVYESRKILHAPDLRVSGTCVRVPVYVGHALSANVEFARALGREEAAALLDAAPGVVLVDGGDGSPTSLEGAGIDPVLVGRLREDPSQDNTLNLWVTGDNLRKGAALNAVQLAELLLPSRP